MKGYIRQRGSSWELFVDFGRDQAGRRHRKTVTVKGSNREAETRLRRMLGEIDSGLRSDPAKINVKVFLREWLSHKPDLQAGSREKYAHIIEQHLIPVFGYLSLQQLRPDLIRAAYMRWLEAGNRTGTGGLSPATIRKFHTVLRQALQTAINDGLVTCNVASGLRLPRGESRQKRALTDEETEALIAGTEGTVVHGPLLILLATGLRRGELLALTWADVDLENSTIAVHRSLEKTASGLRFKSTKTNRGRVAAVPSFALAAMRAHRIKQNKDRLGCGEFWQDNGLVFSGVLGAPWDPAVFSRAFRRAAMRVGVGSIGPHSLRHTAATEMLRQGIHPKVVADRLGHSTIRMTLDVYSHVMPALEADAATKVDTAMRKKFGQHLVSISTNARIVKASENAAKACGTRSSDGGRERSRTSDLYSVKEKGVFVPVGGRCFIWLQSLVVRSCPV